MTYDTMGKFTTKGIVFLLKNRKEKEIKRVVCLQGYFKGKERK